MNTVLFIAWFVSGLIGFGLCRLNMCRYLDDPFCPSPFVILLSIAASALGPFLVAMAAFMWVFNFFDWFSKLDNWFTRSVCRKDRT